jgi:hypothetical protein
MLPRSNPVQHAHHREYWEQFWRQSTLERKVAMYAFAPFLQTSGAILRHAVSGIPPYRPKHKKHIVQLAHRLEDTALHLRQGGLGWMGQVFPGHSEHYQVIHSRWLSGEGQVALMSQDDALFLIRTSIDLMLLVHPALVRVAQASYEEQAVMDRCHDIIEDMIALHSDGDCTKTHDADLHKLAQYALLLECEGIAHQQALVQDGFNKCANKKGVVKPLRHSDEEIFRMAHDIGIDPSVLKEVLSSSYSSWWDEMRAYRARARDILSTMTVPLTYLDPGSPTNPCQGYPSCFSEEDYRSTESVTHLALSLMTSAPLMPEVAVLKLFR